MPCNVCKEPISLSEMDMHTCQKPQPPEPPPPPPEVLAPQVKQYYGHPSFYKMIDELKDLHSQKNRMYATKENPLANFERVGKMISKFLKPGINPALAACLALQAKQIDGIYEMVGECKQNTPDSLDDKLRDNAVYSIIAMIIVKEAREKCNAAT